MTAPDDLIEAVAESLFDYWYGSAWQDVEALVDQYRSQAEAVLAVPAIADALADAATLAKVREIVDDRWTNARNEPWPLTVALEVADAIAALLAGES